MLNLITTFTPGTTILDDDLTNYPLGKAKNVTGDGVGDGTPWIDTIANDLFGFQQFLVTEAEITVSGVPETIIASDMADALKQILRPSLYMAGLTTATDGAQSYSVNPGEARTQDDSRNLILASLISKNINATWVEGTGNGGMADTVTATNDTWYRVYLVKSVTTGNVDVVFDDTAAAGNFFGSFNGDAGGYTDATLYRRIGWVRYDTGVIADFFVNAAEPRRIHWAEYREAMDLNGAAAEAVDTGNAGPRTAMLTPDITGPPNSRIYGSYDCQIFDNGGGGSMYTIITEEQESDALRPNTDHFTTFFSPDFQRDSNILGNWFIGAAQTLYVRAWSSNASTFNILVLNIFAYEDSALVD